MSPDIALSIRGLSVGYAQHDGSINTVVHDVTLDLERGKILGLAGESGCGKSTTALAAIGYRSGSTRILAGSSVLEGTDLLSLGVKQLRSIWGKRVVYVPQASATALTPALKIGRQLAEPLRVHLGLKGGALLERQVELLNEVGIPDPEAALKRYPHQFSGGQQQRVTLAIALSCNPDVLVLDEPTTGLDVTTQARISRLLTRVIAQYNTAAIYVSHDLTLLSQVSDRIAVMYGGQIAEQGPSAKIVGEPAHPYTKALMAAVPNVDAPRALSGIPGSPPPGATLDQCPFAARCDHVQEACRTTNPPLVDVSTDHVARCLFVRDVVREPLDLRPISLAVVPDQDPLLRVSDVWCEYEQHGIRLAVVKGVSFELGIGETLGIVGESGSGKSTLLKAIAGLHPRSQGQISFEGTELAPLVGKRSRAVRRDMQLVFQNPDTSLNPRQTVLQLVSRPLQLFRPEMKRPAREQKVRELLDAVKLPSTLLYRYPGDLSGGQKQRVALARAFSSDPRLLLCDEVTSALDVSVQATILELISELSKQFGTAVVFVSHDLGVVRTIAHRAIVLQHGVVRETARVDELFANPTNDYTRELIGAIPRFITTGA